MAAPALPNKLPAGCALDTGAKSDGLVEPKSPRLGAWEAPPNGFEGNVTDGLCA